jgi:hypothetical protein
MAYRIFPNFLKLLINEVGHVVELLLHLDLGRLQASHGLLSICHNKNRQNICSKICVSVRKTVSTTRIKKENKIFLINKEIQSGALAKSYS